MKSFSALLLVLPLKKELGRSDSSSSKYYILKNCAFEGLKITSINTFETHKKQGLFDDAHLDSAPCYDKYEYGGNLNADMENISEKFPKVDVVEEISGDGVPASRKKRASRSISTGSHPAISTGSPPARRSPSPVAGVVAACCW